MKITLAMNDNLKISIIVPIFKVENYICATIESLLNQDMTTSEYEIILVNDGSPDNCRAICQDYSDKNSNILLINKENGGVSSARNVGLRIAKGEYVMFLDGDDRCEENVLQYLYYLTKSHKLDIALFTYRKEREKSNLKFPQTFGEIVTGPELYLKYRYKTVDNSGTMLFLREFLIERELFYTEGIPFLEDGEYLIRVLTLAAGAAFLDFPYLIRTTREDSATAGNLYISNMAINGYLKAIENLHSFKHNHYLVGNQIVVVNQGLIKFIVQATLSSLLSKSMRVIIRVKKSVTRMKIEKIDYFGINSYYSKFAVFYNLGYYPMLFYAAGTLLIVKIRSIID